MYLVTWEDDDGMFLDDPEVFDSEKEARDCAAQFPPRPDSCVAVYYCRLVTTIEHLPQETASE